MAARLEAQVVTCAASVATAAPTEIPLVWPRGIVRRIVIVIPDGHAGLTGIALGYGHTPIMPNTPGAFISGNDEVLPYDIYDQTPGVQWQAFVCNTDLQPHSWQVRFELDEISTAAPTTAQQPLTVEDINAAGGIITGVV